MAWSTTTSVMSSGGQTAAQLENIIDTNSLIPSGSLLVGQGATLYNLQQTYGVNAVFALGLSGAETGFGRASAVQYLYGPNYDMFNIENGVGWTTVEASILALGPLLQGYIAEGVSPTIQGIMAHYDPGNLAEGQEIVNYMNDLAPSGPVSPVVFLGTDVSDNQGTINWSAYNRPFAFIKATGDDLSVLNTNSTFVANRAGVRANGIYAGYYHFAVNQSAFTPAQEANYFTSVIGTPNNGDVLVLDYETSTNATWALAFLNQVSSTYGGYKPMIYMSQSTANNSVWNAVVAAGYPLWVADYDGSPNFGLATAWASYAFHQYDDNGSVAGISGEVDVDAFNATTTGTIVDFTQYGYGGGGTVVVPPATVTQPTGTTVGTTVSNQSNPLSIAVPSYSYDKIIYSNTFTFNSANPITINTGINQTAYPVGVFTYNNGESYADLGAGQSSFHIISGGAINQIMPPVFVTAEVDLSGNLTLVPILPTGSSGDYTLIVNVALLGAYPEAQATIPGKPQLGQTIAYASDTIISSYNTYRRIHLDAAQATTNTLGSQTVVPHGQGTIPIPLLMNVGSTTTSNLTNFWDSRGIGSMGSGGVALDETNIYLANGAGGQPNSYGYRIYKDNS